MGPRLLHYSDVENAYDEPERVARLAGRIRQLDGDDAIVAGSGDDTAPGVLSLVAEGRQALPFFETAGTDVETFGNHDFDFGTDATRELVADSPQTWVSANVMADGERFGAAEGVVPWTVVETDDARVGVVGLTAAETAEINPKASDLTFLDPIPAARDAASSLRERGVDHVVVLSHLGEHDEDLAAETDVDAVLGGHTHTERADVVDGTVLTRPGAGGHVLYEIDLATGETTRHEVDGAPTADAVLEGLATIERDANLDEVVAIVDQPMERSDEVVAGGECRVGNFVADAYRWAAGADVGLENAGGIRGGPPLAGEVTRADLIGLVPFEETVTKVSLTGRELRRVFEDVTGRAGFPNLSGTVNGHVSGARLTFDADVDLQSATVGGDPLDDSAAYTLATSDFLLVTAYEFPALSGVERVSRHGIQYDVVVDYAREVGVEAAVEGRLRFEE